MNKVSRQETLCTIVHFRCQVDHTAHPLLIVKNLVFAHLMSLRQHNKVLDVLKYLVH